MLYLKNTPHRSGFFSGFKNKLRDQSAKTPVPRTSPLFDVESDRETRKLDCSLRFLGGKTGDGERALSARLYRSLQQFGTDFFVNFFALGLEIPRKDLPGMRQFRYGIESRTDLVVY